MTTTHNVDSAPRDVAGRFTHRWESEPGKFRNVVSPLTVTASFETQDARSELSYVEGELAIRTAVLEVDEDRLARAQIALAAKLLAGASDSDSDSDSQTIVQFELFSTSVAPTINGQTATEEQSWVLADLTDAVREYESIVNHYGNSGEFTVTEDGSIRIDLGLIAKSLRSNATVERLERERNRAETAYSTQWQETASANNRVTEVSALVLVSEIVDAHPTADAVIVSDDGSNLIVVDGRGAVLTELPDSDPALFFSQNTGSSAVRLLPGVPSDHPAITAGFPPNLVFSIAGIRSINERNS
jgi:hypothetical protein